MVFLLWANIKGIFNGESIVYNRCSGYMLYAVFADCFLAVAIFPFMIVDVVSTILFFNLEHQKLLYKLRNKNINCTCYVAMAQMIQCKHIICFNQGFNLILTDKCWHKRDKIIQSINVSSYVSPRLKNNISEIDDVENIKHLRSLGEFFITIYSYML